MRTLDIHEHDMLYVEKRLARLYPITGVELSGVCQESRQCGL